MANTIQFTSPPLKVTDVSTADVPTTTDGSIKFELITNDGTGGASMDVYVSLSPRSVAVLKSDGSFADYDDGETGYKLTSGADGKLEFYYASHTQAIIEPIVRLWNERAELPDNMPPHLVFIDNSKSIDAKWGPVDATQNEDGKLVVAASQDFVSVTLPQTCTTDYGNRPEALVALQVNDDIYVKSMRELSTEGFKIPPDTLRYDTYNSFVYMIYNALAAENGMILALLTVRADDVNPPAATQYRNLDNAAYLANHTGVINDATITNNFSIKIPALGGSLPFVKGDILKIKCYVNAYHYETMEPNSNVVESDDHTLDGSDFNGELIVPIPAPRFAGFCAGQDTGIHLGTVRVDYVIRDPNTNKTKAMPKHTPELAINVGLGRSHKQ
ncbi:hypothetical protein ECB98_00260 [Brucellaceae bacterium VT-16-1752]|uniref:hypothetical protein n=1 Tax=Brucella/Ochrobactrum group TaxID=2826938 RepID=UPI000F5D8CAC|nr:hypothetical protein [Brucella sp. NM4]RRD27535.1 hypothetical protein ECB98_00260 [Brucellaceae bacterium VT-16-1752]WHS31906.1 hypothetical protein QLQ09_07965 [Brucella sp. NM4]WHT41615.1 hypothetical protein QLQ11_09425 [Ochrobactrum sp. SSR]